MPPLTINPPISLIERALKIYARRAPLAWGKYRIINALWQRGAGGDHHREASLIYSGYRVPCDISEFIQRQLYFFGTYFLERKFLKVWQDLARQSDVIFDVGANAGIYSLAASSANATVAVHAFEPTPDIAERLRQTKELNGLVNLIIVEAAVSDHTGQTRLVMCDGGGGNGGMNFLNNESRLESDIPVKTVTLDQYCRDHSIEKIDLIKVDVQGFEPEVFRGSHDLLRDGKVGTVFVELNWGAPGEQSHADDLIDLLDQSGFYFSDITLTPAWRQAGPWMRRYSDIMASQIKDTVRDR